MGVEVNIETKLVNERNRWVKETLTLLENNTNFTQLSPDKYNEIRKVIKGGSRHLLNICLTYVKSIKNA